ncbi:YigZ family protein [Halomonas sp. Bachu 37]|uniref:IMPACT family protein n=1 Tax=Halomonas kashgarensis TaxID=3084920 RepID=UPI00321734EB
MRYLVPSLDEQERHTAEIDVEKSRFLAWLCHAPTPAAFENLLLAARAAHPNASHHCSAFIAGPPGEQNLIGFSDDGEPGGTAGRPMFQVLEGSGIGQVGCVVIRYFGGTKLGTGGLARAYAQAVAKGLEALPTHEVVERDAYLLQVDFSAEAEVRNWLHENDIAILDVEYAARGAALTIGWPRDQALDLSPLENRLKQTVECRRLPPQT